KEAPNPDSASGVDNRPLSQPSALIPVALCILGAAAAWFLLKELAVIFRPLFLAIFLAYVIIPIQSGLREHFHGVTLFLVIAIGTLAILLLVTLVIYGSVVELNADLPQLLERAKTDIQSIRDFIDRHISWVRSHAGETGQLEDQGATRIKEIAGSLVNVTAGLLAEVVQVAFYLIFLVLESGRFSGRIRSGFVDARAEQIFAVMRNINLAMASYLRVKVKASFVSAFLATLVLWVMGVKFALLWGVLTFFANFIPYLGSVVACTLPIVFAFLALDSGWRPITVAVLLAAIHVLSAYVLEPAMTGKAINLSPLVILISLAFWGL